ncbi:Protein MSS51, mitochondrial [Smittium mucronatum]|uniref:Protein MSS51, mitochondrial n=1 Tax=Smittium mucronatum TaxID=133383 RepID=A0A1R0H6M3_9FUNG|nr:Protein MSS51, mitochondrial [Smittium mucronatum]
MSLNISSRALRNSFSFNRCLARTKAYPTLKLNYAANRQYFSFKNLFKSKDSIEKKKSFAILDQADLFHPLSKSPIKAIVEKGKTISEFGLCPTCDEDCTVNHGKDPVTGEAFHKHKPTFECPDCGYPTHCSEEHWKRDKAHKKEVCGYLRTANEDEHDLRSGRRMIEFEFPSSQPQEMVVNFSNWDTFFYTRNFSTIKNNRALSHVSKILTYPITIGAIMHAYSPFTRSKGLTTEGIKSLTAIKTTIKEHDLARFDKNLASQITPIRIFILGARSEAMLPPLVYLQLHYLFPQTLINIYFVGPECIPSTDETRSTVSISSKLSLKYYKGLFHDLIWSFAPFDPYNDIFFMFNPGVGHPVTHKTWKPTIDKLLETKCPIFATGFSKEDMENDASILEKEHADKLDWLLTPTQNPFSSLKKDFGLNDLRVWAISNYGIYGFRGKMYEVKSL